MPGLGLPGAAWAGSGKDESTPGRSAAAETAVARFYKSLTKPQREAICFPFDHKLRSVVKNNWSIVKPAIRDMDKEQKALCREIMKGLTSEEGHERFMRQMKDDSPGGFEAYHVAVFGEPESEKPFEWVLTGRHDTLRVDGNSVAGAAFGGPIFYGHAADGHDTEDPKHTNNVWWPQAEAANMIFSTLDDKQRKQALMEDAEADDADTIRLKGGSLPSTGLSIATLDGQQKQMTRKLIDTMLAIFREGDAEEVRQCLDASGGVDSLRLTFFKEDDLGDDGIWDIWKLEGPAFSWYFRGAPHVHAWLNVARRA
ncbi:DUF3500 domain-containing protein [Aquisphaera giovannonii]|uniref:DUF3500 domain-containing protein n=1 Tax=Aquisphaera giovannonii TaxID=406548 RepID=UPI00143E0966|nr:DUF3500 domain-containing protein [Aquisphaera giovannonii]